MKHKHVCKDHSTLHCVRGPENNENWLFTFYAENVISYVDELPLKWVERERERVVESPVGGAGCRHWWTGPVDVLHTFSSCADHHVSWSQPWPMMGFHVCVYTHSTAANKAVLFSASVVWETMGALQTCENAELDVNQQLQLEGTSEWDGKRKRSSVSPLCYTPVENKRSPSGSFSVLWEKRLFHVFGRSDQFSS